MKKTLIFLSIITVGLYQSQLYTPSGAVNPSTNPTTNYVGIGTYTPNSTLEVANAANAGKLTISTGGASGSSAAPKRPSLDFAGYLNGIRARITTTEETYNTYGSQFSILVNDGSGASNLVERFKILQNGNIGIGTTNPVAKLDVVGGINISQGSAIQINAADVNHGIKYKQKHADNITLLDGPFIYGFSGGALGYKNGTTESAVLSWNNTNVGIGTTSPKAKFDINFGGEPKTIKFVEAPNVVSTMNSMLRFTWYNDTADFGMVRSESTPIEAMAIRFNGNETARFTPLGNMALKGKLEAKEIKVTTTPTADFVFSEDYNLPKLEEVEKFVTEKKHLPEIASAKEMEKEGVNVGEFQIKLLQKIEELTLYSIDQNKKIKELQEQNNELKKQSEKIERLEQMLLELTPKK